MNSVFVNDYVTVMERIEFRCMADFLSSSGGLFGLFIGASFLSLMEFIYFFFIRIFRQRQRVDTGIEIEMEINEPDSYIINHNFQT